MGKRARCPDGRRIADVTYDEPSSAPPFAKPVTFTATVSNSEPVTHAGWGPWEDNPSLSEDLGIAWVSGDGGTRSLGNDAVFITNLIGDDHGSSILEFSVKNFPNDVSAGPSPLESDYGGTHLALSGCDDPFRRQLPQSSSASRFTAGAAGYVNLSQSGERPER